MPITTLEKKRSFLLYTYPGAWEFPSLDPRSFAAQVILHIIKSTGSKSNSNAKSHFEYAIEDAGDPLRFRQGRLPQLEITEQGDSSNRKASIVVVAGVQNIIKAIPVHVSAVDCGLADLQFSSVQKSEVSAYLALLEDVFFDALVSPFLLP